MPITLSTPDTAGLAEAVAVLREWQRDGAPFQLHPGDIGWFWRFGAAATAAAVRIWRRDRRILAVGLLDGADLLRVTIAMHAHQDEELARKLATDATTPGNGVLPPGRVAVEAPKGALVQGLLAEAGWRTDAPWSPLRRDLTEPVEDPGLRIEVVGPELVSARTSVHRSAFGLPGFTDERWGAMAAGVPYSAARCLLAYDGDGSAVAAVTVWSAGPGRPGVIEPMGVHHDHRGRGHGRAITVAAAAALRELGASSALVYTPSSNTGAVATYQSGGFERLPEVWDYYRPS
ncbi:GNAT family N-acetyltransferase [Actinokineospora guangxiensis]|uniref:GNAT family N-acetyltransferase n=1 Tax=Actinokineospora guangxiensis TaxID=1490288 RepID=A0ABW0ESV7_9PSEU